MTSDSPSDRRSRNGSRPRRDFVEETSKREESKFSKREDSRMGGGGNSRREDSKAGSGKREGSKSNLRKEYSFRKNTPAGGTEGQSPRAFSYPAQHLVYSDALKRIKLNVLQQNMTIEPFSMQFEDSILERGYFYYRVSQSREISIIAFANIFVAAFVGMIVTLVYDSSAILQYPYIYQMIFGLVGVLALKADKFHKSFVYHVQVLKYVIMLATLVIWISFWSLRDVDYQMGNFDRVLLAHMVWVCVFMYAICYSFIDAFCGYIGSAILFYCLFKLKKSSLEAAFGADSLAFLIFVLFIGILLFSIVKSIDKTRRAEFLQKFKLRQEKKEINVVIKGQRNHQSDSFRHPTPSRRSSTSKDVVVHPKEVVILHDKVQLDEQIGTALTTHIKRLSGFEFSDVEVSVTRCMVNGQAERVATAITKADLLLIVMSNVSISGKKLRAAIDLSHEKDKEVLIIIGGDFRKDMIPAGLKMVLYHKKYVRLPEGRENDLLVQRVAQMVVEQLISKKVELPGTIAEKKPAITDVKVTKEKVHRRHHSRAGSYHPPSIMAAATSIAEKARAKNPDSLSKSKGDLVHSAETKKQPLMKIFAGPYEPVGSNKVSISSKSRATSNADSVGVPFSFVSPSLASQALPRLPSTINDSRKFSQDSEDDKSPEVFELTLKSSIEDKRESVTTAEAETSSPNSITNVEAPGSNVEQSASGILIEMPSIRLNIPEDPMEDRNQVVPLDERASIVLDAETKRISLEEKEEKKAKQDDHATSFLSFDNILDDEIGVEDQRSTSIAISGGQTDDEDRSTGDINGSVKRSGSPPQKGKQLNSKWSRGGHTMRRVKSRAAFPKNKIMGNVRPSVLTSDSPGMHSGDYPDLMTQPSNDSMGLELDNRVQSIGSVVESLQNQTSLNPELESHVDSVTEVVAMSALSMKFWKTELEESYQDYKETRIINDLTSLIVVSFIFLMSQVIMQVAFNYERSMLPLLLSLIGIPIVAIMIIFFGVLPSPARKLFVKAPWIPIYLASVVMIVLNIWFSNLSIERVESIVFATLALTMILHQPSAFEMIFQAVGYVIMIGAASGSFQNLQSSYNAKNWIVQFTFESIFLICWTTYLGREQEFTARFLFLLDQRLFFENIMLETVFPSKDEDNLASRSRGSLFISYAHKDKEFCTKLELRLKESNYEVWIDTVCSFQFVSI
jgi:hypothetical protein